MNKDNQQVHAVEDSEISDAQIGDGLLYLDTIGAKLKSEIAEYRPRNLLAAHKDGWISGIEWYKSRQLESAIAFTDWVLQTDISVYGFLTTEELYQEWLKTQTK